VQLFLHQHGRERHVYTESISKALAMLRAELDADQSWHLWHLLESWYVHDFMKHGGLVIRVGFTDEGQDAYLFKVQSSTRPPVFGRWSEPSPSSLHEET
jgi:hypothetical protein